MGAELWSYFVPYRDDIEAALDDLKRQEFEAGRYNKGYSALGVPNGPAATIEAAFKQAGADGTRSILDMMGVADALGGFDSDHPSFCHLAPFSGDQLLGLFGTKRPTHEMVEMNGEYSELIDRGLGIYIIVYEGNTPTELFFAGYSFD